MTDAHMPKTEEEWKNTLTSEQYHIMREKGTEPAFTGAYWDNHEKGVFKCAACGAVLFSSDDKFDSGTGWPSFDRVMEQGAVKLQEDHTGGMVRTEVVCANCGSHLGHLFDDGPKDTTGKRFCINSCALKMDAGKAEAEKKEE